MKENNILKCYLLPHPPIIIPEVGKGKEEEASTTIESMKAVANEVNSLQPDTVVVISSHAPMFADFIFMYDSDVLEGNLKQFGSDTKLSFMQDTDMLAELERLMELNNINGGRLDKKTMHKYDISNSFDHGTFVPLYYLANEYKNFKLVVISPSGLDKQRLYKMGQLIKQASKELGRKVVVIASGDMSHRVNSESPYGTVPEGKEFDDLVVDCFLNGDLAGLLSIDYDLRERAGECGYQSLVILSGIFDKQKVDSKVLSYEAPFGIGYCVAGFEAVIGETAQSAIEQISPKREGESIYIKIARETLEKYVMNDISNSSDNYLNENPYIFDEKAGVFVSLKKFGELRGCIGTTEPTTRCIAEEIIQNAISAGTRDPRFDPITPDELAYIDYSVDILGEPEEVESKEELNPKVFGVIVSKGMRRGLLLPDLDGVESVDQQLDIACGKGGIDPDGEFNIYRFTVTRHKCRA